jgi:spore coat polysaccharide biosynthesis protein SpsF
MGSSRLPGKVLADVQGMPALSRLLARLRRCRTLDDIVLATTVDKTDDTLEAWAQENGVACFRGSVADVLERVVRAQQMMGSDIVVEITGDCVLTDPMIVDLGVETYFANSCDIVSTDGPFPSWPMGQCVQVFSLAALEEVERTSSDTAVREHVSLYFYEHPERYRLIQLVAPRQWQAPDVRTQLDYPDDLRFVNEVHRRLAPGHGPCFGIDPLTELLRREPAIAAINAHCREKAAR